jgi:hypothetical protein
MFNCPPEDSVDSYIVHEHQLHSVQVRPVINFPSPRLALCQNDRDPDVERPALTSSHGQTSSQITDSGLVMALAFAVAIRIVRNSALPATGQQSSGQKQGGRSGED